MAEIYSAVGYVKLLHEKFVRSEGWPRKYASLRLAYEVGLNEQYAEQTFCLSNMKKIAENHDMKPVPFLHMKARLYATEKAIDDLIIYIKMHGADVYMAAKQDLEEDKCGSNNDNWCATMNDVKEMCECEIMLEDDLGALNADAERRAGIDELPFDNPDLEARFAY